MVKQICFNPFFPPFVCFPSVDVSLFHTKRALDIGRSIEALKLSQDPSERGRCHRDVSTEGWCQQGWGCCIVVVQFLLFSSANSAPKKETLSEDCEAFNTFYHIITSSLFFHHMFFASFRFLLCCLKYLEVFRMRSCSSKSSEVSCAASASLAWRGIAQIWPSPSSIWMGITSWAAMSSENYTHFCWDICQPWRILRRNGID